MHFIFWLVLFFFLISAFGGRKPTVAATTDSAVEILKKNMSTAISVRLNSPIK